MFEDALNSLWYSTIAGFRVDLLRNSILFTLKRSGTEAEHTLLFKGVSAYLFVHDNRESRLFPIDPDDGDYSELTAIHHLPAGIGVYGEDELYDTWPYGCFPNFSIEIWSSMLWIEAHTVVINGKVFEVGYARE